MLRSMRKPGTSCPRVRRAVAVGILLIQSLLIQSLLIQSLLIQSLLFLVFGRAAAQTSEHVPGAQITAAEQSSPSNSTANSTAAGPPVITFSDALQRATANNPQLQAAFTALGLAHQDLVQSRAALLPNVSYNMQAVYTEPNPHGTNNPIFIANKDRKRVV